MSYLCDICNLSKDITSRAHRKNVQRNGKYRCAECYVSTLIGEANPNHKYDVDPHFFSKIDSESKAYLLGWIASDGTVRTGTITIELHDKDQFILNSLASAVTTPGGVSPPVKFRHTPEGPRAFLSLNSVQMVNDVCRLLHITPNMPKSEKVTVPNIDKSLLRHFIRGYFDGDGSIPNENDRPPRCSLTSNSAGLLSDIKAISDSLGFISYLSSGHLEWSGLHAIDFLSYLYTDSTLYLGRKYDSFLDVCTWQPSLPGCYKHIDGILVNKTREDAIIPSKVRVSDSGYDLTVISCIRSDGNLFLYDTGIKVMPPDGFYFDIVARSSLSKTGYILANSVGVIDRAYRGTILIALYKLDPKAPDLKLPAKIAQMIPRPIVHFEVTEVQKLDDTSRGSGGFGSTDDLSLTNVTKNE